MYYTQYIENYSTSNSCVCLWSSSDVSAASGQRRSLAERRRRRHRCLSKKDSSSSHRPVINHILLGLLRQYEHCVSVRQEENASGRFLPWSPPPHLLLLLSTVMISAHTSDTQVDMQPRTHTRTHKSKVASICLCMCKDISLDSEWQRAASNANKQ